MIEGFTTDEQKFGYNFYSWRLNAKEAKLLSINKKFYIKNKKYKHFYYRLYPIYDTYLF